MIINLTKNLRKAADASEKNNLYHCILFHEAAEEIERLQKKLGKTEKISRSNLFKLSKPAPLALAESCLSNMEGR